MIKGTYLNEMISDCSEAIRIEKEVFGTEYKEEIEGNSFHMPVVHILLYGENQTPVGAARMTFGMDGNVIFDQLGVLENERSLGYADFIMHMIFDKCQTGQVRYLKSYDTAHHPEYFKQYGFEIRDNVLVLDIPHYFETHHCH